MKRSFNREGRAPVQARGIFLCFAAALLGMFCLMGASSRVRAEVVDRILAVVNDDIVTLYEFNQALKPYKARIRSLGYSPEKERRMLSKIREEVLNQLIDEKLAEQEIKQLHLSVSEREIDGAIERFKTANRLSDEKFKKMLEKEGLSYEAYRKRIKEQILRAKLVNRQVKSKIVITQAEIRAYYENHPERYGPKKRYRLRHIFLRLPEDAGRKEKEKKRKKMERILEALKKGAPFSEMARKYSEVLPEEEGRLGVFEFEELSDTLKKALTGKAAGQFTDILETGEGFQIVYVEEIIKKPPPKLEEVSAEIEQILFQEQVKKRYEAWLRELKAKSVVKRIE